MKESLNRLPNPNFENKEMVDAQYETKIRESAPTHSGTKAIIFKLREDEMTDQQKRIFEASRLRLLGQVDEDENKDTAIKVLKICVEGHSDKEFAFQEKAFTVIQNSDDTELAKVPVPLDHRAINVDQKTRAALRSYGAHPIGGKAEIAVVMDYIDGDDLATLFYRWVVDQAPPDMDYIKQSTLRNNFESLQMAVREILGFSRPGGKAASEAERMVERRKIDNENGQKVYDFLRQTGFRLNPKIIKQIKNTRNLLERNGIYHNDEHERNFIITGDYNGSGEVQVHLIDFDRADSKPLPEALPFKIDKLLEQLTVDPEQEKLADKQVQKQAKLNKIKQLATSEKKINESKAIIENMTPEKLRVYIKNRIRIAVMDERSMEGFMSFLLFLFNHEHELISPAEADQLISQMKEALIVIETKNRKPFKRNINPYLYNGLDQYRELFLQPEPESVV